ncbi:YvrJ family protein [Bacillus sp. FJAT-45350]|uniref:YvrJ family protein n=1 Tax=Bacillus sp. FJAT-45350 TaxID=2011014 RepID=UPI000BB739F2|nr:YvrJ family protein [Bacillus sp. FJAT-45350]
MDWITMVAEVSFPILVTFYLLNRIESKLEHLSRTISELAKQVNTSNDHNPKLIHGNRSSI